MPTSQETTTIGAYIFTRLHQLGVRAIFGVPGDYNLAMLDLLYTIPGLTWVGNDNELNSAYAADGYAQAKKTIGAVVTTFGVGELSAVNGIAGVASTSAAASHALMHHTLVDGVYDHFMKMTEPIVVASAWLDDPTVAPAEIDRVLRTAILRKRPGYIAVPTDVCYKPVSSAPLNVPLDLTNRMIDEKVQATVVDELVHRFQKATSPIVLIDKRAVNYNYVDEAVAFVQKTGLPVYVSCFAKGAISEEMEQYQGVYAGAITVSDIADAVASSDLVFCMGPVKTDFNMAFSYSFRPNAEIDLQPFYCQVNGKKYTNISAKEKATKSKLSPIDKDVPSGKITAAWFWENLSGFLQENDLLVVESGTTQIGILATALPKGVRVVSSLSWGSIGYATPAALGAALAVLEEEKENGRPPRRVILLTGEGSFQLTAQSIGTMIKNDLKPIVFILENGGYTVERYIHGMDQPYNTTAKWRYHKLLDAFGAENYGAHNVKTRAEMQKIFADAEFKSRSKIHLIEWHTDYKEASAYYKAAVGAVSARVR